MVAYSFKREFALPIITQVKRSTIRPNGKRRHARVGDQLQHYTGMRTSACHLLMRVPCLFAAPIEIHQSAVFVDGVRKVNPAFFANLALIEGFSSFGNMQAWFDRLYGLPARDLTQIQWNPEAAEFIAETPQKVVSAA